MILLGGFVLSNLLNYEVSKGAMRTTILKHELPLLSDNIYSEIQTDFLRPLFISSLMANDTFVQDWTKSGEKKSSQMVHYLKNIQDQYHVSTAYYISNKTLNYYHATGKLSTLSAHNSDDKWFFRAKNSREPYVVNIDFNYQTDHIITIFINYRVVDENNTFLGIIGVGLQANRVRKLIHNYQANFRRNIYFVDQKGLIRVHGDEKVEGSKNIHNLLGLGQIANRVMAQHNGSDFYDNGNEIILLTWRYFPELKWYLFVELPETQALKVIRKGFLQSLLIAPLVIIPTIFLVGYAINFFQHRLEKMAITDHLTGLKNREYFDATLNQALKEYRRDKRPFSLLMMDVDHFKQINDKKGHQAGDVVLKKIAGIIQNAVREVDFTCRWGGEEFLVLAHNCKVEDAKRLSESIHDVIREYIFFPDDPDMKVTVSFGLTEVQNGDDKNKLFTRMDKALYKAKENGRNKTEIL